MYTSYMSFAVEIVVYDCIMNIIMNEWMNERMRALSHTAKWLAGYDSRKSVRINDQKCNIYILIDQYMD